MGFQSNQSFNPVEYAFSLMLMPNNGQQKSLATCGGINNSVEECETSYFDVSILRADTVQPNI